MFTKCFNLSSTPSPPSPVLAALVLLGSPTVESRSHSGHLWWYLDHSPKKWNYGKENDELSGYMEYFWDIGFLWNIEGIWNPWCPACPLVPHLGTEKHHNSGRICLADVAKVRPFKDCTSLCLTCVRQFQLTWPPWSWHASAWQSQMSQLSYVSNVWRGRRLARHGESCLCHAVVPPRRRECGASSRPLSAFASACVQGMYMRYLWDIYGIWYACFFRDVYRICMGYVWSVWDFCGIFLLDIYETSMVLWDIYIYYYWDYNDIQP